MSKRKGGWVRTYMGVNFYPLDPRPEDIRIEDIAHALSHIARYNGHTNQHISVGQHSILVCEELKERGYSTDVQLIGLLHDASEAYICDIPRQIKPYLPDYLAIEENIQNIIYKKYLGRLPSEVEKEIVKKFDDEALLFEAENFVRFNDWKWKDSEITVKYRNEPPYAIKRRFLYLFNQLAEEVRVRRVPYARKHV